MLSHLLIHSRAKLPFEAMLVSQKNSSSSPTIVVLHGGPHSVYPSSYSKSLAFLFSQGYNLLVVNYRSAFILLLISIVALMDNLIFVSFLCSVSQRGMSNAPLLTL
jgi:hypothetical protein